VLDYYERENCVFLHTPKNAGLFQPKFGSNMDKPKDWVKSNKQMKFSVESGS